MHHALDPSGSRAPANHYIPNGPRMFVALGLLRLLLSCCQIRMAQAWHLGRAHRPHNGESEDGIPVLVLRMSPPMRDGPTRPHCD